MELRCGVEGVVLCGVDVLQACGVLCVVSVVGVLGVPTVCGVLMECWMCVMNAGKGMGHVFVLTPDSKHSRIITQT